MLVKGYVEKVSSNANGIWGFVVDNVRYGTFKTEPKCKAGDYVSFEATQSSDGKYWNADVKTIKRTEAPEDNKQETKTPAPPVVKSTWVPDKDRQDSITYQSARKDALEFVRILADKDLLDYGTGKKADKIAVVETLVHQYTLRFVEDTKRLSPEAKELTKPEPKAKAASKAASSDEEFQDDEILPF